MAIFSSLLLLLSLHIPKTLEDPLYNLCDNTVNYTDTSQFYTNLKQVFSSLSSREEIFYGTPPIGQGPDKAYGLFLCRGDATVPACRNCIKTASDEILSLCPNRSATMWYDDCLLRYSNTHLLGSWNTSVWVYMWNVQNVSDPDHFNAVLGGLMSNISRMAAFEESRKYATANASFSSFSNVYGLAQCIGDISANQCNDCLLVAISQIPNCCDNKRGGRVFGQVCNIRFETYPFYGDSAIADPSYSAPSPAVIAFSPPPPPGPTDAIVPPPSSAPPPDAIGPPPNETSTGTGTRDNSSKIIPILVPTVASAVILFIIVALLLAKKTSMQKKKTYTTVIDGLDGGDDSFQIDFDMIRVATNDFSHENKLGEGGFGPVYKVCN